MKLSTEKRKEVQDRLLARVEKSRKGARCWEWKGTVAGAGYPVCEVNGVRMTVRRAIYLALDCRPRLRGTLRAICRNKNCVNPKHMTVTKRGKGGRHAEDRGNNVGEKILPGD